MEALINDCLAEASSDNAVSAASCGRFTPTYATWSREVQPVTGNLSTGPHEC